MSNPSLATASPSTQQVTWAPVARVNLLPPEIDEGRRFRRIQRTLVSTVVVVIILLTAMFWMARSSVHDAQAQLDDAQDTSGGLQSQQARYSEVPKVTAELAAAQAARASVLSGDVLWNRFLDDIVRARPAGLSVDSVDLAPAVTSTAGNVAVTTGGGVGTLSMTGSAKNLAQLPTWLKTLDTIAGLGDVQLVSAAAGPSSSSPDEVSYSLTTTVTSDALSKRYDKDQ